MTSLVLMVACKFSVDSKVYSKYNSILFKPHMGNIYKSEFPQYRTDKLYIEQTGQYLMEAKLDGYLYAWQKRRIK